MFYFNIYSPYLFNGDFVDRGSWSVECLLTLCNYNNNHFIIMFFFFFLKNVENSYFIFFSSKFQQWRWKYCIQNICIWIEAITKPIQWTECTDSTTKWNTSNSFFSFLSLSLERKTIFHYKRHRYSQKAVDACHELFNYLPLAHCINGKVLVVHGGLFDQDGVTLDDIRKTNRFRQVCIYILKNLVWISN